MRFGKQEYLMNIQARSITAWIQLTSSQYKVDDVVFQRDEFQVSENKSLFLKPYFQIQTSIHKVAIILSL